MNNDEIRQRLYELRRQGREQYLELMGIDVPKVRELEKEIDAQYEELALSIRDRLKDAGKEEAEQHKASLERVRRLMRKDIEKRVEFPQSLSRVPWIQCECLYPFTASAVNNGDSKLLDPPTVATNIGKVTYNATANTAHPFAEVRGKGTGTINSARVNTWFDFAFTPSTDGLFCIRPLVHMNGHWLLWTWGSCDSTPEDRGSGSVKVTLKVQVGQLMLWVKTIEHPVIDETLSTSGSKSSGWYYDSAVDGGTETTVLLQGGHEAIIRVECEIYTQISNHGRAWVDMQTSPHFYFEIPEVRWGTISCLPIPIPVPGPFPVPVPGSFP